MTSLYWFVPYCAGRYCTHCTVVVDCATLYSCSGCGNLTAFTLTILFCTPSLRTALHCIDAAGTVIYVYAERCSTTVSVRRAFLVWAYLAKDSLPSCVRVFTRLPAFSARPLLTALWFCSYRIAAEPLFSSFLIYPATHRLSRMRSVV